MGDPDDRHCYCRHLGVGGVDGEVEVVGAERQYKPRSGHVTQMRIPDELYERLRVASEDHDVAVNWLVVKAITEFLDRLIPADEMKWTR